MTTNKNKENSKALDEADMETTNIPNVIVDLTDDEKTVSEAINDCEKLRTKTIPWYKKLIKKIKKLI